MAEADLFANRHQAGKVLAELLKPYAGRRDTIVLALPRGGVPVGYEIARQLELPLDIFVVRKVGAPIHAELALGAVASGGIVFLNEPLIQRLRIGRAIVEAAVSEQKAELARREQAYRRDRPALRLEGKAILLVDDGLATGASMRAAVMALRNRSPNSIVVAVPVGANETCAEIEGLVDAVVCARRPEDLGAVGMWYEDFTQITDEEVARLLNQIAHGPKAGEATVAK